MAATLQLDALQFSDSPRTGGVDAGHVHKLARTAGPLPPIVVHRSTLCVIDGVHRVHAARLRGENHIDVCYFDGTVEDAFVEAVRLNTSRGLPLTQADRAAAVLRILGTHPQWSDRLIASAAGVTAGTVAAVRKRSTVRSGQLNTREGKDGRLRPVNPAEGRRRAGLLLVERPDVSLRQIAADAGVALATARDVRERMRRGEDPVPSRFRGPVAAADTADPGQGKAEEAEAEAEAESGPADANMSVLVARLCKDPSLRLTEAGRALLQMLSVPLVLQGDKVRQIVEAVPGHRTSSVAQAARGCAQRWLEFAEQLERRT
ncbi:ParB N-terminal domain-containing protein [Streptomyces sp. PRh5]|uniref:ParB N-terminal domain-containing protein n=1 Tax=Streptomyces sp. PRh5 TaxID=1158056 RepID=UPI0012FEB8B0|nr:ParB N-terminal domain-containing protein [Streptomyces sp. PRh5]